MKLENILKKGKNYIRKSLITGIVSSLLFFPYCNRVPTSPEQKENNPPIITSNPITEVCENQNYSYQIKAKDSDGDQLTYSLTEKPNWILISNAGLIKGKAPEVSQNQNYSVKINVSDGKDFDSQNYFLTVKDVPDENQENNTYVLSGQTLGQLSYAGENNLVFSSPVKFSLGNIIVAGISENTPSGFLREVTSISSDKKTIYTKQASLEQALKEGTFACQRTLLPTDAKPFTGKKGISKSTDLTGFDFNINMENVVLYDSDSNLNTTSDQIVANGNLSFNSGFVLDFEIKNYNLEKLLFKNITNEKSDFNIGLSTFVYSGGRTNQEIKIGEYNFHPFLAGYIPTVPPFPIIITPKLEIIVGLLGGPLEVSVTQEATFSLGLFYENGYWQPIMEFSNNFDFFLPTIKKLNVDAYVGQKLKFPLYDVVGPFAGIYNSLKFKTDDETWKLYGGLDCFLGVEMKIFGNQIASYTKKVIDYEKVLAEGEFGSTPQGKIAFVSDRTGNYEIYVMYADGTNQKNITDNPANDYSPSWSPNGQQIAFVSDRDGNPEIYTMSVGGANLRRLTSSSDPVSNNVDSYPDWSPNGSEIVFYSTRNGSGEIYLMNTNGSTQRKLDIPFGAHCYPSWSPDGDKITFNSTLSGEGHLDIYKINRNETGLKRLTTRSSVDMQSSWSPDGNKIAFVSDRDGNYEIYKMNIDGSNKVRLTENSADDFYPSWSPDASKIVFYSGRTGDAEIYVMDADGSNQKNVSNSSGRDSYPDWSPK